MVNNISKDIRYIGVDELDIDLFESQYIVPEGMSYNSWVILDEKVAIMDTADKRKEAEWTQILPTNSTAAHPTISYANIWNPTTRHSLAKQ